MSATGQALSTAVTDAMEPFNHDGAIDRVVQNFAHDVVFTVPGRSAVAGSYQGREGVADFFRRLLSLAGGTFKVVPIEVLTKERHMALFLRFTARRDGHQLDLSVAGFHADRGPDGWRKATFLPDDQEAFDRFYSTS
ncbi:MAG: hypothetical protein NVSMB32_18210 [Actinomycetota bacterium]